MKVLNHWFVDRGRVGRFAIEIARGAGDVTNDQERRDWLLQRGSNHIPEGPAQGYEKVEWQRKGSRRE